LRSIVYDRLTSRIGFFSLLSTNGRTNQGIDRPMALAPSPSREVWLDYDRVIREMEAVTYFQHASAIFDSCAALGGSTGYIEGRAGIPMPPLMSTRDGMLSL